MTLFYLAGSWLVGIGLAKEIGIPAWGWLAVAFLAGSGVFYARRSGSKARTSWPMMFGCLMMLGFGAVRYHIAVPHFDENDLATYNDQGFVTIEGMIVDPPDVRDRYTNLRVQAESVEVSGQQIPVKGLALVQTTSLTEYQYGDPVRVRGNIFTPPVFDDFSYRDYLARQGVYSLVQYSTVEITGPRQGSVIRALMFEFRDYAYQTIERLLPAPQSSLLAGILLGVERGISPDVMEDFNTVGATHVIVISGSNLVILAGVIQRTLRRFLKERLTAFITIATILVYSIFVGGDAAVMRAWFMVTLAISAPLFGRRTHGPASLSFAALIMTIINPLTLWDVSFQLSALATLGLILYVEPLEKLLATGLEKLFSAVHTEKLVGAVSEALIVTVAAQITTTPLIVYTFGRFSVASLPVNFLIIPVQTYLMVLGGLGVLISMVIWPAGQVLAWGSWLFLSWTIMIVRLFASLPWASMTVEHISPGIIWTLYIVLFSGTFWVQMVDRRKDQIVGWLSRALDVKVSITVGLIISAVLWIGVFSLPDGKLHVAYVDVGDGTATFITTPGGRQILIDAGGSGRRLATALGDDMPFWDRSIDLLILTQPTRTHTSGLPTLARRYSFEAVLFNGVHGDTELSNVVWSTLEEQGMPVAVAQPGMNVEIGDGVTLSILHSETGTPPSDEPGDPVVVLLTYHDARFLLSGDMTPAIESALQRHGSLLDVTVLQITRQGHRDATGEGLLTLAAPQISILPVEAGNRYDLPHQETLDRLELAGSEVYRTDQHGTIRLVTDGRKLWIKTSKQ